MAEKTTGLYRLVTLPWFYETFQNLLGGAGVRDEIKNQFFPDLSGKDVLEIGCGPGVWYPWFREANTYTGLDWNEGHINKARRLHSHPNASFHSMNVTTLKKDSSARYDVVIAFGLLHHLSDLDCMNLAQTLHSILKVGGYVLTVDPVYHERQNPIAYILARLDSGQHVRSEAGYKSLFSMFSNVDGVVVTNRLRIPYSHFHMVCSRR